MADLGGGALAVLLYSDELGLVLGASGVAGKEVLSQGLLKVILADLVVEGEAGGQDAIVGARALVVGHAREVVDVPRALETDLLEPRGHAHVLEHLHGAGMNGHGAAGVRRSLALLDDADGHATAQQLVGEQQARRTAADNQDLILDGRHDVGGQDVPGLLSAVCPMIDIELI